MVTRIIIYLNTEKRRSILHRNDTYDHDSVGKHLVLGNLVAESLAKDTIRLETGVDAFLSRPSSSFELAQFIAIK